jgi:flagellar biosynthesis/type III secretory pathway chaperone
MGLDISRLVKMLEKQNSLIEELRDLASELLQALKLDDLNKIIYITGHQEYIGRQLAVLEQQRRMILEKYSQEHGIEIKNFRDLLLHTGSDNFAEIQKSRDEIIDGCQKLREEQGLNALLLKQGLSYTEKMLGVLNGKNSSLYGKTGNIKRAGNIRIVDANA